MSKKHQLTYEGLEKLQKELENLQNVTRVEIAEKLKIAIAYWDLSENSEYQSARDEQAAVEMRISEIEEILDSYEILDVDKKAKKNNTVTIGSTFTLDMNGTKERIYACVKHRGRHFAKSYLEWITNWYGCYR